MKIFPLLLTTSALAAHALAIDWALTDGSTAIPGSKHYYAASPDDQALTYQHFKVNYEANANGSPYDREFKLDLGSS